MAERREYEELNNLKFCKEDILGQGNDTHSTVFKGLFENRDVAVKRIPKQHWSFLLNPNREHHGDYDTHENIARYYLTEEDEDF
jgi:hypothetical protein